MRVFERKIKVLIYGGYFSGLNYEIFEVATH